MATIFVSSTYDDLRECREEVRSFLRRMGHEDIAMEYFTAEPRDPTTVSTHKVETSDVFVGIYAWRYGYIPNGEEKSITELELIEAETHNKRILVFLLDEEAKWPIKQIEFSAYRRIAELRQYLEEKYTVDYFSNKYDLASKISTSLSRILDNLPIEPVPAPPVSRTGWYELPPMPALFVGRDHDLEIIVNTLASAVPEPAIVLGGPAIGKSTMCSAVFENEDIERAYEGNIYYVRLEDRNNAFDVAEHIVESFGEGVENQPFRQIKRLLKEQKTLLILDNIDASLANDPDRTEALLADLAKIGESTILATARGVDTPLGPKWGCCVRLQRLTNDDSRELFLSIAGEKFARDNDLDDIITAIDGIPLAANLMARQAKNYPDLKTLQGEWVRVRTKLFDENGKDERDWKFRTSIELTLKDARLDEHGRQLLEMLGLLPLGVSDEDLTEMIPDYGAVARAQLINMGVVIEERNRIRLPVPVRLYIRYCYPLADAGRRILFDHFLDMATRANRIGWKNGENVLDKISRESDTLEAVIRAGMRSSNRDEAMASVSAAMAFGRYQRFAGIGREALLEKAAVTARRHNDEIMEAGCLRVVAFLKRMRSQLDEAKLDFDKALDLYEAAREKLGAAHCKRGLGDIARDRYQYGVASLYYTEAKKIYETELSAPNTADRPGVGFVGALSRLVEIRRGLADCIERLGILAQERLEPEEAEAQYDEAVEIYREIEDRVGEAHCIKRLGDIAMVGGDVAQAEAKYHEAKEIYESMHYFIGGADCRYSLADMAFKAGDYDQARVLYREAARLYKRTYSEHGKANCLCSTADVAILDWEKDRENIIFAEKYFRSALDIYEGINDGVGIANCRAGLADVRSLLGERERAREGFEEAVEMARKAFNSDELVAPWIEIPGVLSGRWRR